MMRGVCVQPHRMMSQAKNLHSSSALGSSQPKFRSNLCARAPSVRQARCVRVFAEQSSGPSLLQTSMKVVMGGSLVALVATGVAAFSQPAMPLLAEGTKTLAVASKLGVGFVNALSTLNLTQHQAWGVCAAIFVGLFAVVRPLISPAQSTGSVASPKDDSLPAPPNAPVAAAAATIDPVPKEQAPTARAIVPDISQPAIPQPAAEEVAHPAKAEQMASTVAEQVTAPAEANRMVAEQAVAPAEANGVVAEQAVAPAEVNGVVAEQALAAIEASESVAEQDTLDASVRDARAKEMLAERKAKIRAQQQARKEVMLAKRELGLAWADTRKAFRELKVQAQVPVL